MTDRHFRTGLLHHTPVALVLTLLALLVIPGETAGGDPRTPVSGSIASCVGGPTVVTRPIADGIDLVESDGAGHTFERGIVREVEVGPDGTTWIAQGRRVIALGVPGAIEPRSSYWRALPRRLSVTPSGALWAAEDGGSIVALEDGRWVDRSDGVTSAGTSLGILDDGSAWRVVRMADGSSQIASLADEGWQSSAAPELEAVLGRGGRYNFASTSDGRTWLGIDRGGRPSGMAVLEAEGWDLLGALGSAVAPRILGLAPGPDGSLWALGDLMSYEARPAEYVLLHYDGGTWTVFGAKEGMPRDDATGWTDWSPAVPHPITVDQDGKVWFSIDGVGLYSFDGQAFDHIDAPGLRLGALDLAVDPNGCIWVVSARGALYVMADGVSEAPAGIDPLAVPPYDGPPRPGNGGTP